MSSDHVAILLATYQGEKFLAAQLDSLIAQTHQNWTIYASDDGSTDGTLNILRQYQQRLGGERLCIAQTPRLGAAANFLSLVRRAEIQANYYAYCDQDDIWLPERIARGFAFCRTVADTTPALFGSRTRLIDDSGNVVGVSPAFRRPPSFRNALAQNIASGNTMLFNEATRRLLQKTSEDTLIVIHDWWTYLLVAACGGQIRFELQPTVHYRQHRDNQIGAGVGASARASRVRSLFIGDFRAWNARHIEALQSFREELPPENWQILAWFAQARQSALPRRLKLLAQSGVYCQTVLGNGKLLAAALLDKL
ncbi:MAG: glycosyltransferase family 2 protein [Burkholderiales bacterium]|jgi:glycosyltransferase involved in cell wall biosynthesis|nr:glycosyltransferase family 2 protein [Burkholderiales bacterium]